MRDDASARAATAPSAVRPGADIMGAVRWMMVALAAFSLVAVAGREAGRTLATLDIMFYRGWLGLAIVAGVAFASGGFRQLHTEAAGLHAVRAVVHFGAQFSWLKALTLIPLAQLFAIEFTAPLWTALLAALLLGERLTATRVLAGVLGFAGVLVVIRPSGAMLDAGSACALAAAILFAFYYVATKRLTRRDAALTMLFYMNLTQCVLASILALWGLTWPGLAAAGWVAMLTVCSLAAHFALSRAFALADAIVVTPMDFLRLPLISLVGLLLYDEPLEVWVIAGAALVVAGNAINILGEARRPRT